MSSGVTVCGPACQAWGILSELPRPGTVPPLFTSFAPHAGESSGVSLATGFVDFSTGRNSIVAAPGPGSVSEEEETPDREGEERDEEFWALKDVSFEIRRGERVGIIGRITEPTTGRVEIRGRVASLLEVRTDVHPELL